MHDVWLENRTPFEAASHVQLDAYGQEVLVVVVCASFEATENGSLALAQAQEPVCFGDVFQGDPACSSLALEADIAPFKPMVDIVVNATAYAPQGKPTKELLAGIRVGDVRKVLRVTGDRIRERGLFSEPDPFARMPIVYERTYGGTTSSGEVYAENPVGIGYQGALSADPNVQSKAPNIVYAEERPYHLKGHFPPAAFGYVGRSWQPRLGFAGTYDQAWQDQVWPLPPQDFDPRHHQAAPQDQQTRVIEGGEAVDLINLTPSGRWRFRLPRLGFDVRFVFSDRIEQRPVRVDTVFIDAETQKVTLKSRFSITNQRNAPRLREVMLGHISKARLIASTKRKVHFNPRESVGPLVGEGDYVL